MEISLTILGVLNISYVKSHYTLNSKDIIQFASWINKGKKNNDKNIRIEKIPTFFACRMRNKRKIPIPIPLSPNNHTQLMKFPKLLHMNDE